MDDKLINLDKITELFKEKTKKYCYKIDLIADEPTILDDKLGGKPYLPIGEEYPKDKDGNNLALLLQINLKNVDLDGYPKKGILEIFTDINVDYPCQYAIKYFEEDLDYQTELPDINMNNYIVNKSYKINLIKDFCYMPINDYRFNKTFIPIVNDCCGTSFKYTSELDDYFGNLAWYDKLCDSFENPAILIGGYADFTQNDPRYDMKDNKDECLFKLDSCASYDKIHIGDSGILFVIISKNDIENHYFDNAIVDWDCC